MFSWIELALVIMRVVERILNYAHDNGLIDQGRREEIAATAERIAVKTGVRKVILEKVDAMSEEEVDAALADLVRSTTRSSSAPK